jgi:hypothetical protein
MNALECRSVVYSVSDATYFPGLVAMHNSLRLVGHQEPLVVCDCGLDPGQRAQLESLATVLSAPAGFPPIHAKTLAPTVCPAAGAFVLVDADVIFVRPLDDLLALATEGSVVAFADDQPTRFFAEWGRYLNVNRLHRHTYVNAGVMILPSDLGPRLLACVTDLFDRVDFSRSRQFGPGSMADPFRLPDQDCWNAALAAIVPPERMIVLDHALSPFQPWERAELEDASSMRCRVPDGRHPYLLHHIDRKPWLHSVPRSAYSALLPRLLRGEDVRLRLDVNLPAAESRRGGIIRRARRASQILSAALRRQPSAG